MSNFKKSEKPYKCDTCSASFVNYKIFETHSRLHKNRSLSCRFCKAIFLNWNSIKVHLWKAHSVISSEQVRNTIVLKKKAFVKSVNEKSRDVNKLEKFATSPNKVIGNVNPLSNFDEKCEEQYGCVRCNKTFKNKFSLSKHLMVHFEKGHLGTQQR